MRSCGSWASGDLYVGDSGETAREELNVHPAPSPAGANYGWRLRERTIATPSGGVGGPAPASAVEPIYDYARGTGPTQGSTIVGGYVCRGPIAALVGHYFFADSVSRRIWSLRFDGSAPASFNGTDFSDFTAWTDRIVSDAGTVGAVVSFGEDAASNLYVLDADGEMFRFDHVAEPSSLDHFTLYATRAHSTGTPFYAFGPLILTDRFRTAEYNVTAPLSVAVPADKNGEGVLDAAAYVQEYAIYPTALRPRFATRGNLRVFNQCSSLLLKVSWPRTLLVPAHLGATAPVTPPLESEHNLDHFLCYKAGLERRFPDRRAQHFPKGMQVDVTDGFQTRRYDLTGVKRLCTPVRKDINPQRPPVYTSGPSDGQPHPVLPSTIRNPATNVACYKAKIARSFIPQSG